MALTLPRLRLVTNWSLQRVGMVGVMVASLCIKGHTSSGGNSRGRLPLWQVPLPVVVLQQTQYVSKPARRVRCCHPKCASREVTVARSKTLLTWQKALSGERVAICSSEQWKASRKHLARQSME